MEMNETKHSGDSDGHFHTRSKSIFFELHKGTFSHIWERSRTDAAIYQLVAQEARLPHRHGKVVLLCATPSPLCYTSASSKLALAARLPWYCQTSVSRDLDLKITAPRKSKHTTPKSSFLTC